MLGRRVNEYVRILQADNSGHVVLETLLTGFSRHHGGAIKSPPEPYFHDYYNIMKV